MKMLSSEYAPISACLLYRSFYKITIAMVFSIIRKGGEL